MSNIIPISANQLAIPQDIAHLFSSSVNSGGLTNGVGSGGFPVITIKGSRWSVRRGGENTLIVDPTNNAPVFELPIVILKANANISKVFYVGQYVEGSDAAPDCFSTDGVVPHADSPQKQCTTCQACPMNAWGSKISPSGAKIKACTDSRRIAVLPANDLNAEVMMLRVPAASLGELANFGRQLDARGVPYDAIVTKLTFDTTVAYPKIIFNFGHVLSAEQLYKIVERRSDPNIQNILHGADISLVADDRNEQTVQPQAIAQVPVPVVQPVVAQPVTPVYTAPTPVVQAVVPTAPVAPVVAPMVAPVVPTAPVAPAPQATASVTAMGAQLDSVLGSFNM